MLKIFEEAYKNFCCFSYICTLRQKIKGDVFREYRNYRNKIGGL